MINQILGVTSRIRFVVSLALCLALGLFYGLKKASLGLDFTDEGAYLSWPLRLFFGETLFSSEIVTLIRPFELVSLLILKLHPAITLFEFRILGWSLHLAAFSLLSLCLFQISRSAILSVLTPGIGLFASNPYSVTTPSYNTLGSDFFLIFLALRVLGLAAGTRRKSLLNIAAGGAIFIASLCYPPLLVVALLFLASDIVRYRPKSGLWTKERVSQVLSTLSFVGCCAAFSIYLLTSGAYANWIDRIQLASSFSLSSVQQHPLQFYGNLFGFFFTNNRFYCFYSCATILVVLTSWSAKRSLADGKWKYIPHLFATATVGSIIYVHYSSDFYTPSFFALASMAVTAVYFSTCPKCIKGDSFMLNICILASLLAGLLYSTATFYFAPHYSWCIGSFGLPFCFSVSLVQLISVKRLRIAYLNTYAPILIMGAVLALSTHYYRYVYRDSAPQLLGATFTVPKLRHIKSTTERVRCVEELYGYMKPRVQYGEPLLAYDECPMLYFLLDAKPAYGLTWARRHGISASALRQLNNELKSKPLPRYAIRAMVDLSAGDWSKATKVNYEDYQLNSTVLANYTLEKSIYPFEIWRLKTSIK